MTAGSAVTTGGNEPDQKTGPSQLSIQLKGLNSAFAAIGTQQPSLAVGSANGQLLNVTF